MTRGVFYLLTGPAHAARLIVSLNSLRRHYDGPVVVFTTQPESHEVGRYCAADQRLAVEHRTARQVRLRRNSTFITKIALLLEPPFDISVYLDCDTLIVGPIEELFETAESASFTATRFAEWVTTGRVIRKRIARWNGVHADGFDTKALVESAVSCPRPSVNGGVVASRRGADILKPWYELTVAGHRTFIPDEVALHLLLHHHPHHLLDCRFNNSPIYGCSNGVRIWHFHGDKHAKPGKGAELWLPEYTECITGGMAGLDRWGPGSDARLQALLAIDSALR